MAAKCRSIDRRGLVWIGVEGWSDECCKIRWKDGVVMVVI